MSFVQKLSIKLGGVANPEKIKNAVPTLAYWGMAAGTIGLLFVEREFMHAA